MEKLDSVKKWGINTYKVVWTAPYFQKLMKWMLVSIFAGFNVISVHIHYTVYKADVLREVWTRFTNCGP